LIHLDWLYEDWSTGKLKTKQGKSALQHLDNIHHVSGRVTIRACAGWETVSALGVPAPFGWPSVGKDEVAFIDDAIPDNIDYVFHALALNERRKTFKPVIWGNPSRWTKRVKQCWFLGAHSDVGGGYEDIGLSNITLIWMIAQLQKHTKLKFSDATLKKYLLPQDISSSIVKDQFSAKDRTIGWISGFNRNIPKAVSQGAYFNIC
jgi:hypothetical protein